MYNHRLLHSLTQAYGSKKWSTVGQYGFTGIIRQTIMLASVLEHIHEDMTQGLTLHFLPIKAHETKLAIKAEVQRQIHKEHCVFLSS